MKKGFVIAVLIATLCIGLLPSTTPFVQAFDMGKAGYRSTISLAGYGSATIMANGDLYTWGDNKYGALGHGETTHVWIPTKVSGLSNIVAVSSSGRGSATIMANGDLYTWGNNGSGQLGLGDTTNRSVPTKVSGLSDVVAVSLGGTHSAAITSNGGLYTWGNDYHGQLGHGEYAIPNPLPIYIPKRLSELSNVVAVSLGGNHSAAITSNGDLYTWGNNKYGQLGHGGEITFHPYKENMLAKVEGIPNVVAVSLGGDHSAAITSNGDL